MDSAGRARIQVLDGLSGYDAYMARELPAGLSDAQRNTLLEFFAGHITAGKLTERLEIGPSPRTGDSQPEPQSRRPQLRLEVPGPRATRSATRLRRWLAT